MKARTTALCDESWFLEDEAGDGDQKSVERICSLCGNEFGEDQIGTEQLERLNIDFGDEGDIATEGHWHCNTCANSRFNVYTVWTPLENLQKSGGVLSILRGSHRMFDDWDLPAVDGSRMV